MAKQAQAVLYARVSSKEQEREGYSIPAQCKLLRSYAERQNYRIVAEFIDVETAKQSGRTNFSEMIRFFEEHDDVKILLCEKTDRLYRIFMGYTSHDVVRKSRKQFDLRLNCKPLFLAWRRRGCSASSRMLNSR